MTIIQQLEEINARIDNLRSTSINELESQLDGFHSEYLKEFVPGIIEELNYVIALLKGEIK